MRGRGILVQRNQREAFGMTLSRTKDGAGVEGSGFYSAEGCVH